jgi:hypothetical protein
MEKPLIFAGLILILIFFGITWYSIAGIKKNQHSQASQLKRILLETSEPRVLISEYLNDQQAILSGIEKKMNESLNAQQSWIDYSFRKPGDYQDVSLMLENDAIISRAKYDPLQKHFHRLDRHHVGLNISPVKVKQWKKIFF